MSYDLTIYCTRDAITCPKGREFEKETKNWSVTVDGPFYLDSEDLEPDIDAALPGICTQYDLHLNPLGAAESAYKQLFSIGKNIARQLEGISYDPQSDEILFPKPVKRFSVPSVSRSENNSKSTGALPVRLSFWFTNCCLDSRAQFAAFIRLLEQLLPESIPKRYASFEPMQGNLERQGIDHFIDFYRARTKQGSLIFGKYDKPILHHSLGYRHTYEAIDNFQAHMFYIDVMGEALEIEAWRRQIERTFRALIKFLQPFYAEIHYGGHGTLRPNRMFRGLPSLPRYGVFFGKEYCEAITPSSLLSTYLDGLYYVDLVSKEKIDAISVNDDAKVPFETYRTMENGHDKLVFCHEYANWFPFAKQAMDWSGERQELFDRITRILADRSRRHECYNPSLARMPQMYSSLRHHKTAHLQHVHERFDALKKDLIQEFSSKVLTSAPNESFKWNKGEDVAAFESLNAIFLKLKSLEISQLSSEESMHWLLCLSSLMGRFIDELMYCRRPVDFNLFMEIHEWPTCVAAADRVSTHLDRASAKNISTMEPWLRSVIQNKEASLRYRVRCARVVSKTDINLALDFMRQSIEELSAEAAQILTMLVDDIGTPEDKDAFYTDEILYLRSLDI